MNRCKIVRGKKSTNILMVNPENIVIILTYHNNLRYYDIVFILRKLKIKTFSCFEI